jgi:type I restriction enzyme S subunit
MSTKAKPTAKKEEAGSTLVPKLRFPGFQEAEQWSQKPLSSLCELITKGATPTSYGFSYVDEGVRFVKIESLVDGFIDSSKTAHITEDCNDAFLRSQLKENDILFSIAGALGVVALVEGEILPANINQAIALVRLKPSHSHEFLLHQLQSNSIQSEIQRIKAGAAQPNVSLGQLGDFTALLPSPAEQQTIAECLSSVDELMAAQARKVDALKTHKKALMQQLFPLEGETQPRLRFPEFQNLAAWEPKMLVEACRMQAGKFVAAADIKELNAEDLFPCYGGNGLRGFTASHTHDGIYPLIGRQGALCGNVKLASGRFHATEHAVVATPIRGVDVVWLYYLLDLLNLNRFATGQAQPGLSVDVLEKVPVSIPKKIAEQQRIAACLSSLHALISAENQQLEALKTHKKGLTQQLFPSSQEN